MMITAIVTAGSASAQEMDRRALEKREVGNPGGAHYGEFGPPDAYEDGSVHPFYGAENQWSRRMFSKRAADLYYKRRGQRQMLEILDGHPEKALMLANARLAVDADDAESLFIKTVAQTQLNNIKGAWQTMKAALKSGLPFGRFLAGPRDLLLPLTKSRKFQALAAAKGITVLHGPMLGDVTQNSAQFWIRTAMETRFEIRLRHGTARYSAFGSTSKKDNYTGIAHVKGLAPGTRYSYQLYVDGINQPQGGSFTFQTSPPAFSSGKFTIGFGGCAGYTPTHERMWDTLASHDMGAFLFLGDNVYMDMPAMPGAFHEYTYYRRQSRPEFRRFFSSTPVYA
ncbi:MAG: hypothetical protein L3J50_12930, partial [Emcibacter sp.]|nr:hypothetical protein [Emcibacter sp.]